MPINGTKASTASEIRFIPLPYSSKESEASALRLILTVRPEWGSGGGKVEFTQFTEGITNTVWFDCRPNRSFPLANRLSAS